MAGATPYDRPQQSEFINTYVPIPFQEIVGALQNRQRQYESGASKLGEATTGAIGDIDADVLDEQSYLNYISGIQKKSDELVRKHPDLGSLEFKTELAEFERSLSRENLPRSITYNKPIIEQARKNVFEALSQQRPWLATQEMQFLESYAEGGAEKYGKVPFDFSDLPDYADPGELFRKQEFEKSGFRKVFNDDTGELKIVEEKYGVDPDKVAGHYAFQFGSKKVKDPKTGKVYYQQTLENLGVPLWFRQSPEGQQLQQQADFYAANDPEGKGNANEIFRDLYTGIAESFVHTQSGMKRTDETTLTSTGHHRLQEDEGDEIRVMSDLHKKLARENKRSYNLNKKGRLYAALDMFKMGVPGYNVSIAEIIDDVITGLENGGLTYEEAAGKIAEMKETLNEFGASTKVGELATTNLKLPAKFALNTVDLLLEAGFNERIPFTPSEDYVNLSQEFVPEGKTLEDLRGTKEGRALNKKVLDKIDNFANEDVSFETKLFTPKEKTYYQRQLLGGAAKDGVIRAGDVSGVLRQLKIYDSQEPSSEKTFNEISDKNDTVEITGKSSVDNNYNAGIIQFSVNDKTYYAVIDDATKLGGFMQEHADWMLYDFKRWTSGIGGWKIRGDNFYRTKLVSGTHNNPKGVTVEVASEEQFDSALNNGLIDRGTYRGPVEGGSQLYTMQEGESVPSFFERLKKEGIIPY